MEDSASGERRSARLQELLERLERAYLFEGLTDEEVADVLRFFSEEKVDAEVKLFSEGEFPDKFYMILSGEVQIVQKVPGGKEAVYSTLGEGEFFGEIGLLDGFPRSATARTVTTASLLTMDRFHFEELLFSEGRIPSVLLWSFVRTLCSRLREANERIKNLVGEKSEGEEDSE